MFQNQTLQANVLISNTGEACLADFGLSEIVLEANRSDAKTTTNSTTWKVAGNPKWQAPELFEDPKRTTTSDIFAFGRVIYEVRTNSAFVLLVS